MYKRILAVAVLSLSYNAVAADKGNIWQCVDTTTLKAEHKCLASTIEQHAQSDFFNELAYKDFSSRRDAFATVTYFPKTNAIAVKSLEDKTDVLIAANR